MKTLVSIKGAPPVELDLEDIALHEAIAIEDATGYTVDELGQHLKAKRMKAFAALLWLLLRFRLGEEVSYADIVSGAYRLSLKTDVVFTEVEDGEGEEVPTGGGSGETPSP